MTMPQPSPAPARVPIFESVREGFAFVARDWRAILPLALVAAIILTPLQVWQQQAQLQQDVGRILLTSAAAALAGLVFTAAYTRRVLSGGTAPLALGVGRDEMNLAGVLACLAFLFFIVAMVAIMVIGFALAALLARSGVDAAALQAVPPNEAMTRLGAALGADGMFVFFSLLSVLIVFVLWISARLVLAYPATVAEGRMRIFDTWAWTKGAALAVIACLLLTALGGLGLMWVVSQPIGLVLQMVFGAQSLATPGSPANWIFSFVSAVLASFFYAPAYAAMTTYLYRGLRPQTP